MTRLKIAYIVSLAILGILVVMVISDPIRKTEPYSEVLREGMIQTEEAYIVEFEIQNSERKEQCYIISVSCGSYQYSQRIVIEDSKSFTYVHHLYRDRTTGNCATFTICREGETTPFEETTYYLK